MCMNLHECKCFLCTVITAAAIRIFSPVSSVQFTVRFKLYTYDQFARQFVTVFHVQTTAIQPLEMLCWEILYNSVVENGCLWFVL